MASLRAPFTRMGRGLHSGTPSVARVEPGPPGLWFANGDGAPTQLAPQTASAQPGRSVWIGDGFTIDTPEHLLAALVAYDVFACTVRVWGGELPALDGCAEAWCAAIESVGVVDAPSPPDVVVQRLFAVEEAGGRMAFRPYGGLRVTVEVDFGAPLIGQVAMDVAPDTFRRDVAGARTFVLERDVDRLLAAGHGKGADAANTCVLGPTSSPAAIDEAVRHKWLDVLGDLGSLGAPLHADVRVRRPSHRLHITALRALAAWQAGDRASR